MLPLRRAGTHNDCTAGKLSGKAAVITGGDRGIGRAVAIAFAKEGADIAIIYLNEHRDAEDTRQTILQEKRRCVLVAGDVANEEACRIAIKRTIAAFGRLDILVNAAAEQPAPSDRQETRRERCERTFRTNLLGMFYLTKAAMPHLPVGGTIINTTAAMASHDGGPLIDDTATTGTIASFTRSLAQALVDRRISVNAVVPGPAGKPPISAGFSSGSRRARYAAPDEIAPRHVFLAAQDGSFTTGRVLHARSGKTAA